MSSSRNWLYAVGGAVAGTAAVIVAIAVVSQLNDDGNGSDARRPARPAASRPSPPESPARPSRRDRHPTSSTPAPRSRAPCPSTTPATGRGHACCSASSSRASVATRSPRPRPPPWPARPATRTTGRLWPAGTEATASYDGDVITVDLTGAADLHDRPAGMSKRDAEAGDPAGRLQRAGRRAGARRRAVPARRPAHRPGARRARLRAADERAAVRDRDADEHHPARGGHGRLRRDARRPRAWPTPSRPRSSGRSSRVTRSWPPASAWPSRADRSTSSSPGRSPSTSPASTPATYTFVATNDDPSGG